MNSKSNAAVKPFPSAVAAAEKLFEIADRARVVAKVKEGAFAVCSRSKARRLGFEIVAKNY